jgi:hypothetical protein
MNFLRKAIPELQKRLIRQNNQNNWKYVEIVDWVCEESLKAEKFVLPNGGRIFASGFRALPDILNLPFPEIVLEYTCKKTMDGSIGNGLAHQILGEGSTNDAPNRIVYAVQRDIGIAVFSIVEAKNPEGQYVWVCMPYAALIQRTNDSPQLENPLGELDNPVSIEGVSVQYQDFTNNSVNDENWAKNWERYAAMDLNDETCAVLSLIEALSCKNVNIEKLPTRKLNKGAQKRGALPFDEYHVLTVSRANTDVGFGLGGGSHRSPREHLRRGHIRRLPQGNVWVNSTIVNPNIGGKINKIYELQGEMA